MELTVSALMAHAANITRNVLEANATNSRNDMNELVRDRGMGGCARQFDVVTSIAASAEADAALAAYDAHHGVPTTIEELEELYAAAVRKVEDLRKAHGAVNLAGFTGHFPNAHAAMKAHRAELADQIQSAERDAAFALCDLQTVQLNRANFRLSLTLKSVNWHLANTPVSATV